VLKLSGQVRSTHNQDGAVLLDVLHGQMYWLNFVGSRMLELLKQAYTEEQIADEISRAFGVARETVVTDLQEFLAHLQKHRLLETRQAEHLSNI
jgi:hypothetical protein